MTDIEDTDLEADYHEIKDTMPAKDPKLKAFNGSKSCVEINEWLNLFNIVKATLGLETDQKKTIKLMSYLEDEALSFYATKITINLENITWIEVKALLTKRFSATTVSPLISATHQKLRKTE